MTSDSLDGLIALLHACAAGPDGADGKAAAFETAAGLLDALAETALGFLNPTSHTDACTALRGMGAAQCTRTCARTRHALMKAGFALADAFAGTAPALPPGEPPPDTARGFVSAFVTAFAEFADGEPVSGADTVDKVAVWYRRAQAVRAHPLPDVRQALAAILPYAESRIEDMAACAEEARRAARAGRIGAGKALEAVGLYEAAATLHTLCCLTLARTHEE